MRYFFQELVKVAAFAFFIVILVGVGVPLLFWLIRTTSKLLGT